MGSIIKHGSQSIQYQVQSVKDLAIIIKHFDAYPLLTQKWADYLLFKQVLNLINREEHLTIEGLKKIIAIKASINRGLSDELKAIFPNITPTKRLDVLDNKIKNPQWIAGFSSAEGSFMIKIIDSPSHKLKETTQLEFKLTQHKRDEQLMKSLIEYFDCGNLYKDREYLIFIVRSFSDLTGKIIPFFVKNPIIGVKSLDFYDWCKVAELMKEKKHLTNEGLTQIRKIKAAMNRGRK